MSYLLVVVHCVRLTVQENSLAFFLCLFWAMLRALSVSRRADVTLSFFSTPTPLAFSLLHIMGTLAFSHRAHEAHLPSALCAPGLHAVLGLAAACFAPFLGFAHLFVGALGPTTRAAPFPRLARWLSGFSSRSLFLSCSFQRCRALILSFSLLERRRFVAFECLFASSLRAFSPLFAAPCMAARLILERA